MGNCGLIGAFSSASGKADTVMDTNGQILYYNNGRKALNKGDNDEVLTLKSGLPSWEAVSGGATAETDNAALTSDFTSTSTTFVDITGLEITIGNIANGKTMMTATITLKRSDDGGMEIVLEDDGSVITSTYAQMEEDGSNKERNMCTSHAMDSNGSVIKVQCKTGGGTLTIEGNTDKGTSQIVSMSVG